MSRYFVDMLDIAKTHEQPDLIVERVVGRMLAHEAWVLSNVAPGYELTRYMEFRGDYVVNIIKAIYSGEAPVDIIWTLLHNLAHEMAAGQFRYLNGSMPVDDLWYPGCYNVSDSNI